MQFGMTEAKTWHVIRGNGSKVCGSGGKIVKRVDDAMFIGNDEWMCIKCELSGIIEREPYEIVKSCTNCGTVFSHGGFPYDSWAHKHFAIKDEHNG